MTARRSAPLAARDPLQGDANEWDRWSRGTGWGNWDMWGHQNQDNNGNGGGNGNGNSDGNGNGNNAGDGGTGNGNGVKDAGWSIPVTPTGSPASPKPTPEPVMSLSDENAPSSPSPSAVDVVDGSAAHHTSPLVIKTTATARTAATNLLSITGSSASSAPTTPPPVTLTVTVSPSTPTPDMPSAGTTPSASTNNPFPSMTVALALLIPLVLLLLFLVPFLLYRRYRRARSRAHFVATLKRSSMSPSHKSYRMPSEDGGSPRPRTPLSWNSKIAPKKEEGTSKKKDDGGAVALEEGRVASMTPVVKEPAGEVTVKDIRLSRDAFKHSYSTGYAPLGALHTLTPYRDHWSGRSDGATKLKSGIDISPYWLRRPLATTTMMARPALARRNDNVLAARDMHHGKLLGAGVTLGIGGGIGIGAGGIIVSNGPAPPAPTPQPVVAPSPNAPVIAVPSVVDQPRHPPPPVTSTIFFTPNPTPATPTPATPAPATPTPSAASPTFPTLGAPSSAGNPGRGSPSHTPAQDTTTQIGPTPNNVPSLATGPTNSNTASSTKLVLGLTIPLALLFLVGLPAFLYFRLRRARARKQFAATLKRSSMNASPGSFRTESDDKPQVPPADADAGTSGAAAAGSATALEEGKAPAPVNKDAKSVVKSVVKK